MSYTGLPQFIAATIGRLRGDAALAQLVTGVYDEVPSTARPDYIVVDAPIETPDGTFGQNGHELTLVLSIVTRSPLAATGAGKAGFVVGLAIAERALALLTDLEGDPVAVDDHDVSDVSVVSVVCVRESDGLTRRVDVTISANLEDALA